jgi:hypothetical protein
MESERFLGDPASCVLGALPFQFLPEAWLFGVVLRQLVFETWVVPMLACRLEPGAAPEVWQIEVVLLQGECESWMVRKMSFHSAGESESVLGAWSSGAVLPQEPLEVFGEAYHLELEALPVEHALSQYELDPW